MAEYRLNGFNPLSAGTDYIHFLLFLLTYSISFEQVEDYTVT